MACPPTTLYEKPDYNPKTSGFTISSVKRLLRTYLVINGTDRASHGKGIRALSYSAFVVGLLRYCRQEKQSYPGLVVLDSPLVAYREPDSMLEVEEAGVKESFYASLAKHSQHSQIIVFENEEPSEEIIRKITYTHFSGDDDRDSRSGFFPNVES